MTVKPSDFPKDAVFVEDSSPSITYAPGGNAWEVVTESKDDYTAGVHHLTYKANSTATFTFTGKHVWFISERWYDLGRFSVNIDGNDIITINARSDEYQKMAVLFEKELDPGKHVLVLRSLDEGAGVDVDQFVYLPGDAPPTSDPPTPTINFTSTSSSSSRRSSITSTVTSETARSSGSASLSSAASVTDSTSHSNPGTGPSDPTATTGLSPEGLAASNHNLSRGAIAGAVVAALLAFFALILALAIWRYRRRRIRPTEPPEAPPAIPYDHDAAITALPTRASMKRGLAASPIGSQEKSTTVASSANGSQLLPSESHPTGSVAGTSDTMDEPALRELHGALQRAGLTVHSLLEMHRGPGPGMVSGNRRETLPAYHTETVGTVAR